MNGHRISIQVTNMDLPFETKAEHAAWLRRTERTLDNWRNQPDGLPYTTKGRTPLFNREWTLEWLKSRRRQNNPTSERGKRQRAA
jgi:hypothetical protein